MRLITPSQCRAARGLLDWSQPDLAKRSGIHVQTISNFEQNIGSPSKKTLETIAQTFETNAIEFTETGVQLKRNSVLILEGADDFLKFYDEVYLTVKESNNKYVYVSNVDERKFVQWQKEQLKEHSQRMNDLDVQYKILIEHGDNFFPASAYAQYRWVPKNLFLKVPHYMYGDKLAMILFEETPRIYIIHEAEITKNHRKQFEMLWEKSTLPNSTSF